MQTQIDHLKRMIIDIKGSHSVDMSKKLNLKKWERMIEKLGSFSASCEECQQQLLDITTHFKQIRDNVDLIDYKQHKRLTDLISSHLQKKHKLIPEGYYLGIYMSFGISVGVIFGLTIFDNIGVGLPLGMVLGISIGTSLDADAKKKGKTI